ncbi:MAG: co-chaperone GroES [Deltaproteobacteria bacterium]|nr:co-chaperone GroES [Deltaproteobacteria bacterium]
MNIQPLGEYVLIRLVEATAKSAGGLFLPESAKETPDEGIVVAMAAEATDEVKIGDRVIYKKFSGNEIEVEGVKHRLMPAADLLAKYVEADAIPE